MIRLKMLENHWMKIENGSMNKKFPKIRCQSHLCIKMAFRTEVSIPRIMKAQKSAIEFPLPRTA